MGLAIATDRNEAIHRGAGAGIPRRIGIRIRPPMIHETTP